MMLELADFSIRPRAPCADDRPLEVPITDTQRNEASFPAQAADLDLLLHLRRNAGRQLSWSSARTGCNALSRRSAAARFAAGDTSTTGCRRFAAATGGRAASGRAAGGRGVPVAGPARRGSRSWSARQNGGADSGGQQRAGGRCGAAAASARGGGARQRQPNGWSAKPLPRDPGSRADPVAPRVAPAAAAVTRGTCRRRSASCR
jgi:hypothetical protein